MPFTEIADDSVAYFSSLVRDRPVVILPITSPDE